MICLFEFIDFMNIHKKTEGWKHTTRIRTTLSKVFEFDRYDTPAVGQYYDVEPLIKNTEKLIRSGRNFGRASFNELKSVYSLYKKLHPSKRGKFGIMSGHEIYITPGAHSQKFIELTEFNKMEQKYKALNSNINLAIIKTTELLRHPSMKSDYHGMAKNTKEIAEILKLGTKI